MDIIKIRENREFTGKAARWFHCKWGIDEADYMSSMESCVSGNATVPQWYIVIEGEDIIAGAGVIENDFHIRTDLAPNLCSVYVEEPYRGRGIAGELLSFICRDFEDMGIDTLYLITDHIGLYERYGWIFLCTAGWSEEPGEGRIYVHRVQKRIG